MRTAGSLFVKVIASPAAVAASAASLAPCLITAAAVMIGTVRLSFFLSLLLCCCQSQLRLRSSRSNCCQQ